MSELPGKSDKSQKFSPGGAVVDLFRGDSEATISNNSFFTILNLDEFCPYGIVRCIRVQDE